MDMDRAAIHGLAHRGYSQPPLEGLNGRGSEAWQA
jgi:hypothetical protein